MANPFTVTSPTQYVPKYAPAPLEQYASTFADIQQQHMANIAQYSAIDVMLAQKDISANDEWIREEAKNNINNALDGVIKSGRWRDATYLLPLVYKDYVGANKDLLWAEKQNAEITKAKDMAMQYGTMGINFNPWDNFTSVSVDPLTKEKKYNTFTPDIEQRTDRVADVKSVFDDTARLGSSSGLTGSSNSIFLRYTETNGLQPGQYKNFLGTAYEAFKQTPSYRQMMKEYTNPYTTPFRNSDGTPKVLNETDADKEILKFVDSAGREFLGSAHTKYVENPLMKAALSGSKGKGKGKTTSEDGLTHKLPASTARLVSVGGVTGGNKIKIDRDGNPVVWDMENVEQRKERFRNNMTIGDYLFFPMTVAKTFGKDFMNIHGTQARLMPGKVPLSGEQKEEFNHLYRILKSENPNMTDYQVKELAAERMNSASDLDVEVNYEAFTGDEFKNMVNSGYYYNSNATKGSAAETMRNISSLNFWDKNSKTNFRQGDVFFRETIGDPDKIVPLGRLLPENGYRLNNGIVWEVKKGNDTYYAVSDGGMEYEQREEAKLSALVNSAKFNTITYMSNYSKDDPTGKTFYRMDNEGRRIPENARIYVNPRDNNSLTLKIENGPTFKGEEAYGPNGEIIPPEDVLLSKLITYYGFNYDNLNEEVSWY